MKIILVSHGNLAQSMLETASMFVGEHKDATALGLYPGTHPDDFVDDLLQIIGDRKDGSSVLILCDLLAGTPFNKASGISHNDAAIKVIYGMNLGMVAHVLDSHDKMGLNDLAEEVVRLMPEMYGIGEF